MAATPVTATVVHAVIAVAEAGTLVEVVVAAGVAIVRHESRVCSGGSIPTATA